MPQIIVNDDNYLAVVKKLVTDERKVSKGSNLQNIASKGDGVKVRNAFKPRPGFAFVGSDLGQIEPRIQAHIMFTKYGDNSMRQIFMDRVDLYSTMAARTFKIAPEYCVDKAYDPTHSFQPRKLMKTGVLAVSYDQSPKSFSSKMGVSMDVADHFFTSFNEAFPSFKPMVKDIRDGMKRTGYVETLFGRKRRFPDYATTARIVLQSERRLMQLYIDRKKINSKKVKTAADFEMLAKLQAEIDPIAEMRGLIGYWERAAFNAVIQGTGADILKINSIEITKEAKKRGWELQASIHDELKPSMPLEQLREGVPLVNRLMCDSVELAVPLISDTVIETAWMQEYGADEWDYDNLRPYVVKYDANGRVVPNFYELLAAAKAAA